MIREIFLFLYIKKRPAWRRSLKADLIKEPLINSRLTAGHATRLHLFRQAAQKISARRQPYLNLFVHPDKKSDGAIYAPELISVSLNSCNAVEPGDFRDRLIV